MQTQSYFCMFDWMKPVAIAFDKTFWQIHAEIQWSPFFACFLFVLFPPLAFSNCSKWEFGESISERTRDFPYELFKGTEFEKYHGRIIIHRTKHWQGTHFLVEVWWEQNIYSWQHHSCVSHHCIEHDFFFLFLAYFSVTSPPPYSGEELIKIATLAVR